MSDGMDPATATGGWMSKKDARAIVSEPETRKMAIVEPENYKPDSGPSSAAADLVSPLYPDGAGAGLINREAALQGMAARQAKAASIRRQHKDMIAASVGAEDRNELAEKVEKLANGELDKKDALLAASHGVLEKHNKQLLEEVERKNELISELEHKLERAHERVFQLTDLVYSKWMKDGDEGHTRSVEQAPTKEERGASEEPQARDDGASGAGEERGAQGRQG